MDVRSAKQELAALVAAEMEGQDRMWGPTNERADATKGQLMHAAMAQLSGLDVKLETGAFPPEPPTIYPQGWAGFRDYGSNVANLVVAVAFLSQEIKRRLIAREDTTRLSRDQAKQAFGTDQPSAPFPGR